MQPNSNCSTRCGSVEIPFPFGTSESCCLDSSFLVTCNHTSSGGYTPYLSPGDMIVLNISLDGEVRVLTEIARSCYDRNGTQNNKTSMSWIIRLPDFLSFSSSRNKLTAVGCNTIGEVLGYDPEGVSYTTGCLSTCLRINDTTNGVCNGPGCCQSPIPAHGRLTGIFFGSSKAFLYRNDMLDFNPCGYTFVAEDGAYNYSSTDLANFPHESLPMVLDWTVGNLSCLEAKKNASKYACKAENMLHFSQWTWLPLQLRYWFSGKSLSPPWLPRQARVSNNFWVAPAVTAQDLVATSLHIRRPIVLGPFSCSAWLSSSTGSASDVLFLPAALSLLPK
ncbi:hypothetical protein PIB30_010479 [Stylosanthes scabra]|uniref:Wall-associated receptor kinase galacturonan-binding domain-containing protein n=1 Tax=Stylosanthes scabra TaxID=79078 RepID=A0ABU6Z286_9FABA|nr:hypothetical protein [Stylosanthes scabra]